MKNEFLIAGIGSAISLAGTVTQLNDVLQTISLVITILGAIISFIVVPVLSWYRNAKKDGKIDEDELSEAAELLEKGVERTKDEIEKRK